MSDLSELEKYRQELLLAELAAWLHDDSKHTDQFIYNKGGPKPSGRPDASDLIPKRYFSLFGEKRFFSDVRKRSKEDFIDGYLRRCHNTAHIDKQDGDAPQSYPFFLSTPFGFESVRSIIPKNLTKSLRKGINWSLINSNPFSSIERDSIRKEIISLFSLVGGDTRRPSNEINLWEWGHLVAAFYKASLAGALIGFEPTVYFMRWRLLSFSFNGLSFYAQSARLSDLLARRELLNSALDKIRELLEIKYPLGTEIYRDENCSIFIVPGCYRGCCSFDLLNLQEGGKTLKSFLKNEVNLAIDGELLPNIKIDLEPWWGQDPNYELKKKYKIFDDELPKLSDHLQIAATCPNPSWVKKQWNHHDQICVVCGLRPHGPGKKAKERDVCDVCEQRRSDRSMNWAKAKLNTTIWTDEVADINGRMVLLVGRFELKKWLDGDLVRTLAIANPSNAHNKTSEEVSKNPSFARLRRIWQTTRGFWQSVCPTDERKDISQSVAEKIIEKTGKRLEIKGRLTAAAKSDCPGPYPYHAYDLILSKNVKMSVVWDPENNRFTIADNLKYIEKQLTQSLDSILKKGVAFSIEEATGYGSKSKVCGTIILDSNAEPIDGSEFTPVIPILAEPRTFMALVPADKALDVASAIKEKYEREMGKVRNRLPLHLGLVYAHRRTPLRAILDAGRRMLDQKSLGKAGVWTVQKDVDEQSGELADKIKYLSEDSAQFSKWFAVNLINHHLNRKLTWHVPAVMGDGTTPDNWYPYLFWLEDHDGSTDPGNAKVPRKRYFQAENPRRDDSSDKLGWLVHAGDLKEGDSVYFTPATLDFQWLDSSGRRFEIAYDGQGQRRGLSRRPYLLDELEILNEIWQSLKNHLTKNQIYILRDLIEARRAEWADSEQCTEKDVVFRKFCSDALSNADWQNGKGGKHMGKMPWGDGGDGRSTWLKSWTDYAARGWIADVVELHLQIMKEEI